MIEPMQKSMLTWLVPRLIVGIYYILAYTIRWQCVGKPFAAQQEKHFLLSFWHARILMLPYAFRGWQGYMLISEHRDGSFISDAINILGFKTVRGSSTRGGARAMLKMLRLVKQENCDLAITPDGPKGPAEQVSIGAINIAIRTGLPILPVCYATDRKIRAKSWDRFYLPYPFTRGVFVFGDYLYLSKDIPIEKAMHKYQQVMNENQQCADSFFK
ncbi:MAG: lysophospholipid acyltransferase family protein [Mariprofundales bacterium]